VSPHADECVGLDINPRAVAITRLNADLNEITNCTIHLDDAIANGPQHGRFDLVTWNTPFVFLPEHCKDTHFDAFGGDMGMEILLDFLGVLPDLLDDDGRAYLAAAAPILRAGKENLLEPRLEQLARERGLVIREHVTQFYWHEIYREFHERHGIRRFEHSFLEIVPGPGRLERIEAPLGARAADVVRELAFSVRK
jgi:methylase of polypeptide subunit release factors